MDVPGLMITFTVHTASKSFVVVVPFVIVACKGWQTSLMKHT